MSYIHLDICSHGPEYPLYETYSLRYCLLILAWADFFWRMLGHLIDAYCISFIQRENVLRKAMLLRVAERQFLWNEKSYHGSSLWTQSQTFLSMVRCLQETYFRFMWASHLLYSPARYCRVSSHKYIKKASKRFAQYSQRWYLRVGIRKIWFRRTREGISSQSTIKRKRKNLSKASKYSREGLPKASLMGILWNKILEFPRLTYLKRRNTWLENVWLLNNSDQLDFSLIAYAILHSKYEVSFSNGGLTPQHHANFLAYSLRKKLATFFKLKV